MRKRLLLAVLVFGFAFPAFAEPAEGPATNADLHYQKALASYLAGDYDEAILQVARSLEKDPEHMKSKNLLTVLAAEKDREKKTVIWLSGKPVLVSEPAPAQPPAAPAQDLSGLENAIQSLAVRVERFFGSQRSKNADLERRITVVQELLKSHSGGEYAEIRASQAEIYAKLKEIESKQGPDLTWLYLLCGASVLISLAAFLRDPKRDPKA